MRMIKFFTFSTCPARHKYMVLTERISEGVVIFIYRM